MLHYLISPENTAGNGGKRFQWQQEVDFEGLGNGWSDFTTGEEQEHVFSLSPEKMKKRKSERTHNLKVIEEEEEEEEEEQSKEKRIKSSNKEDNSKTNNMNSKNSNSNRETSNDTSKASEIQKSNYIHVRARRGQATDSHSLAERVRREKISERMKYLQDLVPGCNKITGKAGMLDEIINYVQSLQSQVEFLSMKLAAINPGFKFNVSDSFAQEMFQASMSGFQTMGVSSSETANQPAYTRYDPLQQEVSCFTLSIPQMFIENPGFSQINPSPIQDTELLHISGMEFQQGRSTPLMSQPFTGSIEAGYQEMQM